METGGRYPVYLEEGCFLNFLRGMETLVQDQIGLQLGVFLNFLRGMETDPQPQVLHGAEGLPKLP